MVFFNVRQLNYLLIDHFKFVQNKKGKQTLPFDGRKNSAASSV